ncbi:MAG TPA: DUF47 family protein [Solirubrobacteraceae bacterium]|nr:DUF47 family protein [Solirubrobacteraceae bacterium]
MSARRHRRWFLPERPDVLGMLDRQALVTADGMTAFQRWAHGEQVQAQQVRLIEHAADECKQDLTAAVREAFTTPLEPEDLFDLSQGLDEVLNRAKDTVREAEALGLEPDEAMGDMADLLLEGVDLLRVAFGALGDGDDVAGEAATAAIKTQRRLERVYRAAMPELLESDDLREVVGRQELYRRLSDMSDRLLAVAERVNYATVKEL